MKNTVHIVLLYSIKVSGKSVGPRALRPQCNFDTGSLFDWVDSPHCGQVEAVVEAATVLLLVVSPRTRVSSS